MPDERRYLQSKLRKKTCNPKFEESYIFQVSHKSFDDRILKFTMFDVDRHRRHNVIGHALFPLKEYDCENNERMVIWRDLEKEVSENKIVKSKKTAIVKRTIDPNFSESFTFKLSSSSLDTASISVSTMQHFTGAKDKMIGRVVLGSFMFARGRELDHWNEMLSSQRDQISYWHSLT
uniref:C2 domain-containing protein n=1 Tax=Octopus bimaculoides TaxID=37653 RepID=A0A0L8HDE2_OCTBM